MLFENNGLLLDSNIPTGDRLEYEDFNYKEEMTTLTITGTQPCYGNPEIMRRCSFSVITRGIIASGMFCSVPPKKSKHGNVYHGSVKGIHLVHMDYELTFQNRIISQEPDAPSDYLYELMLLNAKGLSAYRPTLTPLIKEDTKSIYGVRVEFPSGEWYDIKAL